MHAPSSGRTKQVTDPLHDKVKARLRGDDELLFHTGCDGQQEAYDLFSFACGFFISDEVSDDAGDAPGWDEGIDDWEDEIPAGLSDGEGCRSFYAFPVAGMVRDMANPKPASAAEDRFRRCLQADAAAAADRFAELSPDMAAFRRAVMGSLRDTGYDAGICHSKWKSGGGGLVAGNYEYIDVVTASPAPQRYIVDVGFAGEFEVARPTTEYCRLVAELPGVFVGRPEELRRLLRVLAEAAMRSLRSRELHVPPWRKGRYTQAKWLGPYRRTVNHITSPSASSSSPSAAAAAQSGAHRPGRGEVKYRLVGFDASSASVIRPAAGTR